MKSRFKNMFKKDKVKLTRKGSINKQSVPHENSTINQWMSEDNNQEDDSVSINQSFFDDDFEIVAKKVTKKDPRIETGLLKSRIEKKIKNLR